MEDQWIWRHAIETIKKQAWREREIKKNLKTKKKKTCGTMTSCVIGAPKEERVMNRNIFQELIAKEFKFDETHKLT